MGSGGCDDGRCGHCGGAVSNATGFDVCVCVRVCVRVVCRVSCVVWLGAWVGWVYNVMCIPTNPPTTHLPTHIPSGGDGFLTSGGCRAVETREQEML